MKAEHHVRHDVHFYGRDDSFADAVSPYLIDGFRSGEPAVTVCTPQHSSLLLSRVLEAGFSLTELKKAGALTLLDARATLSTFMRGSAPHRDLFIATVGQVFDRVLESRKGQSIRAFGEMVDVLWKDGNQQGALAVEDLWNELAETHRFSLLCAYEIGPVVTATHTAGFEQIRLRHTSVLGSIR